MIGGPHLPLIIVTAIMAVLFFMVFKNLGQIQATLNSFATTTAAPATACQPTPPHGADSTSAFTFVIPPVHDDYPPNASITEIVEEEDGDVDALPPTLKQRRKTKS